MEVAVRYTGRGERPIALCAYPRGDAPVIPADLRAFTADGPFALTVCAMHWTDYGQRAYLMEETAMVDGRRPELRLNCATVTVRPVTARAGDAGTRDGRDERDAGLLRRLSERNTDWYRGGSPDV